MPVTVRRLEDDDILALRSLLEEWKPETNPDGFDVEFDVEVTLESLYRMNLLPMSRTLVMVDDADGGIVGCVGLISHSFGVTKDHKFASENLWFVRKSHTGYASKLINECTRIARDEMGLKYLIFSSNRLCTERSDTAKEWLQKIGFKPLYQLFIKEI